MPLVTGPSQSECLILHPVAMLASQELKQSSSVVLSHPPGRCGGGPRSCACCVPGRSHAFPS